MRYASALMVGLLLPASVMGQACAISVSPLVFGPYNFLATFPQDSTSSIVVSCDAELVFTIRADAGIHSNGGFTPRYMSLASGEYKMAYLLALDASFTRIWGDGSGDTYVLTGTGNGTPQGFAFYGRIPARQTLKPGQYRDSVSILLEY